MLLSAILERSSSNNASQVTIQWINLLKIKVTRSTIIDTIEGHPDFPSLYSISESLRSWKVENAALRIEEDQLGEVPVPFIAHLKKGKGYFSVVTNVNSNTITFLSGSGQEKQKSREEFLHEWSEVVLVAEPSEESGEKNFLRVRKKEAITNLRIPFIVLCSVSLVMLYLFIHLGKPSWLSANLLLILKLAGVLITSLLLWFEIDKENSVLKQVCGGGTINKTNCTAVLNSKHAKLFNWISWSEIGFFYFTGSFLFMLINKDPISGLQFLAWVNLVALPYTIFSIVYQWKVARQWCLLCLTVQALLLLEFAVSYWGLWDAGFIFDITNFTATLYTAFISFLFPILFWIFIKQVLLRAQEADQLKKEFNKFKFNPLIFQALLPKGKKLTSTFGDLGITLGNPKANNTIVKVCNPYCGPCAKAHLVIDEILEDNNDVNVQIIFTASNDDNDSRSEPVRHLMALYEKNDATLIKEALNDWYGAERKNYKNFAEKYLLNGELQKQGDKLTAMSKWCEDMQISFTPTFFINGYQLPEVYRIEDIKHLLQ